MRRSALTCSIPSALALAGSLLVSGCSHGNVIDSDAEPSAGSVRVALDVAPNLAIDSVAYDITGNGVHRTGSFSVTHSTRIQTLVGGIPAGSGYAVSLSAVGTGGLLCAGAGSFNVTAGAVAMASVHVECRLPRNNGTVVINGTLNVCPLIDDVSIAPTEAIVGHEVLLAAIASDVDSAPSALSYAWSSSSGTLINANSAAATLTCTSPGVAAVTLVVSDGDCTDTVMASVTCTEAVGGTGGVGGAAGMGGTGGAGGTGGTGGTGGSVGMPLIVINEVESNGGTPGDWVELHNAGDGTADLSGWIFRDNDDTHTYVLPVGTTIAAGAYYMLDESAFGFGLGGNESARLFDPSNTLYASYSWTAHAAVTYGRCPNATGAFAALPVSTRGAINSCADGGGGTGGVGGSGGVGGTGGSAALTWQGSGSVSTVDVASTFGTNMSGLTYEPATVSQPAVLWAVQNSPSKLFRLLFDGTNWVPDANDGWSAGKTLQYPTASGAPDTESVTKTEWASSAVYVATERDNNANTISRMSILQLDSAAATDPLVASREWNLNADLPVVGANLGLEAISWIPDTFLTARGFIDESTGLAYNPASYAAHADGVFFVGVEGTGMIYGYVLDHAVGTYQRVATITGPHARIAGMEYDRDGGYLWSYCDDFCANQAGVLEIEDDLMSANYGRFVLRAIVDHPAGLISTLNNEGLAFAPEAECVAGQKQVFWSDDNETGLHALRQGTMACGQVF